MTFTKMSLALLVTTAIIVSGTVPSYASKNNGAFKRSIEGTSATYDASQCRGLKDDLQTAEREANKRAGTPAAKEWADRADAVWAMGQQNQCAWAR